MDLPLEYQSLSMFDYMQPPQSSLAGIVHTNDYIKKGERSKGQRKIWENTDYDDYEMDKIVDFKAECKKENIVLPSDWLLSDSLKLCYISKFKTKYYLKNLKSHLQWRANPLAHNLTDINIEFLSKGIVYTVGRDMQQRPIILMNLAKINIKQFSEEAYINALSFFLYVIKKQCFVPGKIENWLFIIDIKNIGITDFPFKALKTAIGTMQVNFCGCLEKLYMLDPSSSLSFSWSMISAMADPESISKIQFLKPKEYIKMQERIPPHQLEQQYGGTLPDLKIFWPPLNLEVAGGEINLQAFSVKIAKNEEQKQQVQ